MKATGAPVDIAGWTITDDNHEEHQFTLGEVRSIALHSTNEQMDFLKGVLHSNWRLDLQGGCAGDKVIDYYLLYKTGTAGCNALPAQRQSCQCFGGGLGSTHDEARLLSPEVEELD